jgi:cyclophilin family peptidyl-prolyl cis-trans isomerase
MAKRKHTMQRTHPSTTGERPGFSRRSNLPPPSARGTSTTTWLVLGGVGVIALLAVLAYAGGYIGRPGPTPSPSPAPTAPRPSFATLAPPSATPLASPPAAPAGNGTTATIETDLGNIVIELYNESAPVAAENFINLAKAGFYDGVVFHRTIANFMIQGGDPLGSGGGGPGYEIRDDPVVGDYSRGQVAMARPAGPNGEKIPDSAGSQFFIMVANRPELGSGGYAIFGNVVAGMDVVDAIVAGQTTGPPSDQALNPVVMRQVTIQAP